MAVTPAAPAPTTLRRYPYLIVGFVMSLVMGVIYAWSIFVLPLERQFHWTRAQTQLTFTIAIISLSISMIVCGRIADRLGPRVVAACGAVLVTVGALLASYTTSLGMLYFCYGVLVGFGVGTMYVCALSAAARWFQDRKGFAMGIVAMGFGLGGFFFGGIVGQFINSYGWQWAFRVLSVASLILLVGGSLLLRYPPPGWAPPRKQAAAPRPALKDFTWYQMLQTGPFWAWFVWDLVICIAGLMVMAHVVPLAVGKGLARAQAAWAMGMLALFNAAGRILFGWLYDLLGRNKAMVLEALCMVIGVFGIVFFTPVAGVAGLFLALMFTGLGYGGAPVVNSTFMVNSFGYKNAGLFIGMTTMPMMLGVFIGPYLGSFVQMSYGYDVAVIIGGCIAIVGVIAAFVTGDAQKKYEPTADGLQKAAVR